MRRRSSYVLAMEYAILGVVALLIGLGVGWYLGGRPAAELKARLAESERDAKETDARYLRAYAELEAAREKGARVDALDAELKETRARHEAVLEDVRRTNGELSSELATLKEKTANFDEQKRLLVEAREELLKEFQNTGSAVLTKAQEAFLERANERFGHSEKSSEEKIRELLAPVGERLAKYEKQVSDLEEKRTNAFSSLAAQIEQMRLGQEEVRREAQRLGNSLTNAPKARGRWGERALQNVLEQCGLSEHTDFLLEHFGIPRRIGKNRTCQFRNSQHINLLFQSTTNTCIFLILELRVLCREIGTQVRIHGFRNFQRFSKTPNENSESFLEKMKYTQLSRIASGLRYRNRKGKYESERRCENLSKRNHGRFD